MNFLKFLNQHRTKIMGFIITILGAVQAAAPQLVEILDKKTYALVMVVAGILVSAIGFINTHNQKAAEAAAASGPA